MLHKTALLIGLLSPMIGFTQTTTYKADALIQADVKVQAHRADAADLTLSLQAGFDLSAASVRLHLPSELQAEPIHPPSAPTAQTYTTGWRLTGPRDHWEHVRIQVHYLGPSGAPQSLELDLPDSESRRRSLRLTERGAPQQRDGETLWVVPLEGGQ